MASENYVLDTEVFATDLVERLRAAVGARCTVTFRRDGDPSSTEAKLPAGLLLEARRAIAWQDGQTSVPVYLAKPRDSKTGEKIAALAGKYAPRSIATAVEVSTDTVYALGGPAVRNKTLRIDVGAPGAVSADNVGVLLTGLAAIRRRERIDQRDIAARMGISPAALSAMENREEAAPAAAVEYWKALGGAMRLNLSHFWRQAIEIGSAIRAVNGLN